jgi:hypothetical protein
MVVKDSEQTSSRCDEENGIASRSERMKRQFTRKREAVAG